MDDKLKAICDSLGMEWRDAGKCIWFYCGHLGSGRYVTKAALRSESDPAEYVKRCFE